MTEYVQILCSISFPWQQKHVDKSKHLKSKYQIKLNLFVASVIKLKIIFSSSVKLHSANIYVESTALQLLLVTMRW